MRLPPRPRCEPPVGSAGGAWSPSLGQRLVVRPSRLSGQAVRSRPAPRSRVLRRRRARRAGRGSVGDRRDSRARRRARPVSAPRRRCPRSGAVVAPEERRLELREHPEQGLVRVGPGGTIEYVDLEQSVRLCVAWRPERPRQPGGRRPCGRRRGRAKPISSRVEAAVLSRSVGCSTGRGPDPLTIGAVSPLAGGGTRRSSTVSHSGSSLRWIRTTRRTAPGREAIGHATRRSRTGQQARAGLCPRAQITARRLRDRSGRGRHRGRPNGVAAARRSRYAPGAAKRRLAGSSGRNGGRPGLAPRRRERASVVHGIVAVCVARPSHFVVGEASPPAGRLPVRAADRKNRVQFEGSSSLNMPDCHNSPPSAFVVVETIEAQSMQLTQRDANGSPCRSRTNCEQSNRWKLGAGYV